MTYMCCGGENIYHSAVAFGREREEGGERTLLGRAAGREGGACWWSERAIRRERTVCSFVSVLGLVHTVNLTSSKSKQHQPFALSLSLPGSHTVRTETYLFSLEQSIFAFAAHAEYTEPDQIGFDNIQ